MIHEYINETKKHYILMLDSYFIFLIICNFKIHKQIFKVVIEGKKEYLKKNSILHFKNEDILFATIEHIP